MLFRALLLARRLLATSSRLLQLHSSVHTLLRARLGWKSIPTVATPPRTLLLMLVSLLVLSTGSRSTLFVIMVLSTLKEGVSFALPSSGAEILAMFSRDSSSATRSSA